MAFAMLENINFTDARSKFSPIFDKVIHKQQPIIVKRKNKEEALLINRELQSYLLRSYCLTVEELSEDDGSVTLSVDSLELYTNADTKEAAIVELIEDLKVYAEDYMQRLSLFLNAPNRKEHLPYIMRILLCESDAEVMEMLKFK